MNEVSVMVLPGVADGEDFKPRMLLYEDGLWHETGPPDTDFQLADIRRRFAAALEAAVRYEVDDGFEELAFPAAALANDVLPKDVREALASAREAGKTGETPRLTLHVSRSQEWIPWEAMNVDGYLGLDFEIARLPVLDRQPRQAPVSSREVEKVRSVLGREVADPPEVDFDVWAATFADLPLDMQVDLMPTDASSTNWPTLRALVVDAEILHVTCHGLRDDTFGLFWTLDPSQPKLEHMFVLDAANASSLEPTLAATRPLIFGNACAAEDAAPGELSPDIPALATKLFEYGAANVVGSFASLSIPLAMRFAKVFYRHLLVQQEPVACALRSAKREFYEDPEMRDDPTYLLYCLYGPADTRYGPVASGAPRAAERVSVT